MWNKLLVRITNGEKNIPSPYHKDGILEHLYIMLDEKTRIGYLLIWCTQTHKGAQISRVEIPYNVNYVLADDIEKMNIPDIELQNIYKD